MVAPPYDVIDPALQQALYDRSPHNVIRLILNKEEPGDDDAATATAAPPASSATGSPTTSSSADSAQSLYVYSQEYEAEGRRHTRRGFLARVRLEPFGAGRIYPHEETLPGPRADRLRLFHATEMNLSPVFGLYPDPDDAVIGPAGSGGRPALPLQATDHLGVVSKLWPVSDQGAVSAVTGAGAEAGLHRRRPPPLRDRPALPPGTAGGRRARTRRPSPSS